MNSKAGRVVQGREAAPPDWRGPQRSEDTGQTGLSLEQIGRVAMRREKAAPTVDRPDLANDMEQNVRPSRLKLRDRYSLLEASAVCEAKKNTPLWGVFLLAKALD